jgi:quercetin dioxygenase-like cupin family protein
MVARDRRLVVNKEGDSVEITAGDVVHSGPGEVHWHGGSRESFMIHTAVSLGNTSWFGEVSNDDYLKESK